MDTFGGMRSPTNQLIVIILVMFLMPILIYFTFEISSVKEEEAVLEKVYQNQLDAVLFSVNQYSDNIINSTIDKLEKRLNDQLELEGEDLTFLEFSRISGIFLQESPSKASKKILLDDKLQASEISEAIQMLFLEDSSLINQLCSYKKSGYRKVLPAITRSFNEQPYQVIFTVLDGPDGALLPCVILLNPTAFVNDVLSPRLQQMAGQDLIIAIGDDGNPGGIYTTDTIRGPINLTKALWLFPGLEVGVSPKGPSVGEIIADRTDANLLAVSFPIVLLILGSVLIIRNIRREMRLAQAKSDFVSNVSHELRTPLALISMFGETLLLERYKTIEKRKEYENIIVKESGRLTNIVNKILNFSQIEANKRKYQLTPLDLNALTTELLNDYSYHLEANGFTFDTSQATSVPMISGDKEAIYEALVNLIDNAMKYSPEKKHLSISTGTKDDLVYVSVQDHGVGIATHQIKQIFDKFYRVTEGDVQTTRGAGLGLSLVKHIMDAHEGDIEVASEPGKGSTFKLVFKMITP